MDKSQLEILISRQKEFFNSLQTQEVAFRKKSLKQIKSLILQYENELHEALRADLGRPEFEAIGGDTGLVLQELGLALRKLNKWTRTRRARTPLLMANARSFIQYQPYGNVLILSPWNYPFQLLFVPLIGAVSAGNCVLAKPSKHAIHTSAVMREMINSHFDPAFIHILEGGGEINKHLLEMNFDYIFFTGSQETGKKVMKAAADNLTPVSLELGGKNPVIVDRNIHLKNTAKRILWGKYLNAGQSCVAPDYLLVHEDIKDRLMATMKEYLERWMGPDPEHSKDFSRIINERNIQRFEEYIREGNCLSGGQTDRGRRYVAFTILDGIQPEDRIMQEEIFGPLLPVLTYQRLEEAIEFVSARPRPLSLYVFTRSRRVWKEVMLKTSSGNSCLNETVVQFINPHIPFGGTGSSGMGRYHGKSSFETFSNKRSYMKTSNLIDIPVRYPPYGSKARLLKRLMG